MLIADDQKGVGDALAAMVSQCQHEVVDVVGSGLEAMRAYTRHLPDVVLMDYWMPNLNGSTACRNIISKYPGARIILVSGWTPLKDIGSSGAIAILAKPVAFDDLYSALHAAASLPAPNHGPAVGPN